MVREIERKLEMEDLKYSLYLYNSIASHPDFEEHEQYMSLEDAMNAQRDYAKLGILSAVAPIGRNFHDR